MAIIENTKTKAHFCQVGAELFITTIQNCNF